MDGQSSTQSNFDKNKKKSRTKEFDVSKDIIVNFKYDDYEPVVNKYRSSVKKNTRKIYDNNLDLLDQSQFRFILNLRDSSNIEWKYSYDLFINLRWEDINSVIYYSGETYICPICLEQKIVVPRITRCGHIFCWPCLDLYFEYWTKISINKKIPHCPLCMEKINIHQIKFCDIIKSVNYSEIDSQHSICDISFNLIMKDKKSHILNNIFYDPYLDELKKKGDIFNNIPLENQREYSFTRIFLTTPQILLKRYSNIKSGLQDALIEEKNFYSDELKVFSIEKCLASIENKIKCLRDNNIDLNSDDEDYKNEEIIIEQEDKLIDTINVNEKLDLLSYTYFYQEQFGDVYFLHPINYMILLTQYGKEENLPTVISGRILEIEMHQMTQYTRNKYKFLNHLKNGSIFFFVEIDMKNNASSYTLKQYPILVERAKIRNKIKKEEEHYDMYVQNIIENEQRKFSVEYETQKIKLSSEDIENTDQIQEIQDNSIKEKSKLDRLFNNEIDQQIEKEEVKINTINESDFPEINEISQNNQNKKKDIKSKKKKKFTDINMDLLKNTQDINNDIIKK